MARAEVATKVAALKKEGSIPPQFHCFFWDTDSAAIDLHRHAAYVIARILETGSLRAVWWLQLQYPTSAILQVLASSKGLSARSRRFWSAWFEDADGEPDPQYLGQSLAWDGVKAFFASSFRQFILDLDAALGSAGNSSPEW
jgi:hypothetical protein